MSDTKIARNGMMLKSHWLMLLLVLAASKDTKHYCKVSDPPKGHRIKEFRVNSTMVAFQDRASYAAWKSLFTPSLVEKIIGRGVLINYNTQGNKIRIHVFKDRHDGKLAHQETNDEISSEDPRHHSNYTAIEPETIDVLDSLLKIANGELESDIDIQSIIPNDSAVTAYNPEIKSCHIKSKAIKIKLDEGEKRMSMEEFKKSGLKLGLVYKDRKLEYVLANDGSLRCVRIKPLLKRAMKVIHRT